MMQANSWLEHDGIEMSTDHFEVEHKVQLADVAKIAIEGFNEAVDELQDRQLILQEGKDALKVHR